MHGCSDVTIWRFLKKHDVKIDQGKILSYHVRTEEHKRNIGLSLAGKKLPQETRAKMRASMLEAVKRGHPGCFQPGHKPHITPERNAKISTTKMGMKRPDITGPKNKCWKGGISFKYSRYLDNYTWDETRWRILKRDKHTCQHCGLRSKYLDVHHKIPFAISRDDSDDNLISLCRSCHMKEEWKINPLYQQRAQCSN